MTRIRKVIAGGQTGVDRAGLDAALALGLLHGGWCPKGRRAEDGVVPAKYQLTETESRDYGQRTLRNIREADGTLILIRDADDLYGGTKLTLESVRRAGKPFYLVTLSEPYKPGEFAFWHDNQSVETLNIAGPRESKRPGIYAQAFDFIVLALRERQ